MQSATREIHVSRESEYFPSASWSFDREEETVARGKEKVVWSDESISEMKYA